ncbi:MAG: T9SS type A sorting domain-containing protein [Bacteroidales bacterium]
MRKIFVLTFILTILLGTVFSQTQVNFGELINSVDLGSQTATPDRNIVGIQSVGDYLFVTGFDPDDYWQHKLYKFTSDGSELLDTYSYGIEAAGWKDLAWDGEFLYVTDMDTIRQLDLTNGQKTGVTIPAPFYYNQGLAYNPMNDHFYVSGEGGNNIYEIDRNGEIIGAIANYPNYYTGGLAIDTVSPGAPFLWTYSSEAIGYNMYLKGSQISLLTNEFTGIEFEGESISSFIVESAGGATISYDYIADSVAFITINIRNGNINDQMEYAMFYDITRDEVPGPQISVNPTSIQNTLPSGDSIDVVVNVFNDGDAELSWSAYVETPNQDTIDNLGDLLYSFNASQLSQNNDKGMNGITFLNDRIWVNGRNFPNQQSVLYEFDKTGLLLQSHPYYTQNSIGFRSITNDGEYLYGEDTYVITQIDPETFSVVGYILKPSGTFSGLTYDPQTDHFWGGNGNGLIIEFDRDGNEINVFITPYDIQGLAWDQWSPQGPFIWAWNEIETSEGSKCEAIRLDPATCTTTGVEFNGFNFSNATYRDIPKDAVVTNQWEDNKVTLIGLQSADVIVGNDTIIGEDYVSVYDLDVIPPPGWIELLDPSFGSVPFGESGQFTVRLKSIMNDTLMTALIRVYNNDILNPQLIIPVNFEMTSNFATSLNQNIEQQEFYLGKNYPNPFNQKTIIPIRLTNPSDIRINIFNTFGVKVGEIAFDQLGEGDHQLVFDAGKLPSGMYYYSVETDSQRITHQMIIKK